MKKKERWGKGKYQKRSDKEMTKRELWKKKH